MSMKNKAAQELGSAKTPRKSRSSAKNGKNWKRPHLRKCARFEREFPHKLDNNEWKVKWPMEIDGRKTTYNPDYWCEELKVFVETVTSRPNISEQGAKWAEALRLGFPLRIFWWEGQEITSQFDDKEKYRGLDPRDL